MAPQPDQSSMFVTSPQTQPDDSPLMTPLAVPQHAGLSQAISKLSLNTKAPGTVEKPVRPPLATRVSGPHIKLRRFSGTKSEHSSAGEEDLPPPNVNFFLDNRLPTEYFKQDILMLIHTLKIPKWKYVESTMAADMVVTRLSGALTNAVYHVAPPTYLKERLREANEGFVAKHRLPLPLLLRVYGPQVEHLIDRDSELRILQRLGRKNIGPKMMGTFTNGRFEQFFHAKTLSKEDLRDPDTSVQIAKRMRELHDHVRLLPEERMSGPGVWVNFEKWGVRAKEVLEILDNRAKTNPAAEWTCQTVVQSSWDEFLTMVAKYRSWLEHKHGGAESINKKLVFAHNDTQYGNLLRLEPPPGSPLLQPQLEHRQLIVIDFEYASPNARGFDICNHFCEWMSDYHDAQHPETIHEKAYPTVKEQLNLLNGYVEHGLESFDDEDQIQVEVDGLMEEVRDWRPAVHLYWLVWGIVQAVIDQEEDDEIREELNMETGQYTFETEEEKQQLSASSGSSANLKPSVSHSSASEVEEEEDPFDYLSYASQKAQLFWSDMIRFGLLDEKDYKGVTRFINA
ncbi:kinase-like domain-containing protein [Yarrowia lipolytica]|uniref:YALI0E16907p n=2 Tax=Yarrowia lipolytica TaxID=4952 RepID=Q6C5L9_YARLI|nr:YALI0E16907p [Yarrowia lipolytica CLIB122]AOW05525.1 hypothetical protein YALI1_E20159g [Yarrowia lipolytica]KAB8282712.1 kinase-like domain-containing protein [Yarrowia lipolytica]KAE8173800.1 kinase-like domain-containing protein [Yarrowia lipolytica]KAJ8057019.1 kinase-like domain-containing protein [Yarrowia lipolytica]QNP99022.1 Ethanolamine kinase [Yarrowia lipolytica]|eukprot:XP_504043.1 YALI0E16907p [Yarrowia lipolytica CLIB122]